MIVKNKRNGTNVLAYRDGASIVKIIIPSGAQINIPHLKNLNQVVNKADFKNRGWFDIIEEKTYSIIPEKISALEKAKKEVEEYEFESTKNRKIN